MYFFNNGSPGRKLAASSFHYSNDSRNIMRSQVSNEYEPHKRVSMCINDHLKNGHEDMLRTYIMNVKSVVILLVNSCHNTTVRHWLKSTIVRVHVSTTCPVSASMARKQGSGRDHPRRRGMKRTRRGLVRL